MSSRISRIGTHYYLYEYKGPRYPKRKRGKFAIAVGGINCSGTGLR